MLLVWNRSIEEILMDHSIYGGVIFIILGGWGFFYFWLYKTFNASPLNNNVRNGMLAVSISIIDRVI